MYTRILIFALLFAGVIEAEPPKEKDVFEKYCQESGKCSDKKHKLGGSVSYNSYAIRGCESEDELYQQISGRLNYDYKPHKNIELHSSAAYARTILQQNKFSGSESTESGYGTTGLSFWSTYFRIRGDFKLMANYERLDDGRKTEIQWLPMGGGLVEAGKMHWMWGSVGCLNPEMPYGLIQAAFNVDILNKVELGVGWVFFRKNQATFENDDDMLSFFLRAKINFSEYFAIKGFFGVKPYTDYDLMFEGTFGMEFSF